jgi:hypothetical protein
MLESKTIKGASPPPPNPRPAANRPATATAMAKGVRESEMGYDV